MRIARQVKPLRFGASHLFSRKVSIIRTSHNIINERLIRTLFIIQQNFIRTKYFDRESDLLQYSQPLWIIQLESISMKFLLQHHHHTPRCSLVLTTTTRGGGCLLPKIFNGKGGQVTKTKKTDKKHQNARITTKTLRH